jgi:hypothetical protein
MEWPVELGDSMLGVVDICDVSTHGHPPHTDLGDYHAQIQLSDATTREPLHLDPVYEMYKSI